MTDIDQPQRCESLSWTDRIRCIHPAGHPGDHTNQLATDVNQVMWIDNPDTEPKQATSSPRQQDMTAEHRLRLAHAARRAKEHQLDDIRRALCDIGFMEDDDPYSHADLADVIRQVGQTLRAEQAEAAPREQQARPAHPDGTPYGYAEMTAEGWNYCDGCRTWITATQQQPHRCPQTRIHGPFAAHDGGPTVQEATTDDRRWPLEKAGE